MIDLQHMTDDELQALKGKMRIYQASRAKWLTTQDINSFSDDTYMGANNLLVAISNEQTKRLPDVTEPEMPEILQAYMQAEEAAEILKRAQEKEIEEEVFKKVTAEVSDFFNARHTEGTDQ